MTNIFSNPGMGVRGGGMESGGGGCATMVCVAFYRPCRQYDLFDCNICDDDLCASSMGKTVRAYTRLVNDPVIP